MIFLKHKLKILILSKINMIQVKFILAWWIQNCLLRNKKYYKKEMKKVSNWKINDFIYFIIVEIIG